MNYQWHYDQLVERGRHRKLSGYRERHHVLPRCMGGVDDSSNLVNLTPREHYTAHQLLAKMHPSVDGIFWAAIRQARNAKSGRVYDWLRCRLAVETGKKHRGKVLSPEHRKRLITSRLGVHSSAEHKEKIALALKGHSVSEETRAKIGAALRGRKGHPQSEKQKERLRTCNLGHKYWLGKKHSMESREKMSQSRRAYWERRASA